MSSVKQYLKHCQVNLEVADRRNIAAGNVEWSRVDLVPHLLEPLAVPPLFRAGGPEACAAGAAAAAAMAVDPDDPTAGLAPVVSAATEFASAAVLGFTAWKSASVNNLSAYYLSDAAKTNMLEYWLRVRKEWRHFGCLMIWWLSHPAGTAGLERDFCGMTMVIRQFRRNRWAFPSLRCAVLAHCHKAAVDADLAALL